MPYKSKAQRAYMHIHHPGIAERWDEEHPKSAKSKKLPEHVKRTHGEIKKHIGAKKGK